MIITQTIAARDITTPNFMRLSRGRCRSTINRHLRDVAVAAGGRKISHVAKCASHRHVCHHADGWRGGDGVERRDSAAEVGGVGSLKYAADHSCGPSAS